MYSSHCGGEGHNKQTCSQRQPKLKVSSLPKLKYLFISFVDASDNTLYAFIFLFQVRRARPSIAHPFAKTTEAPNSKKSQGQPKTKPMPLSPYLLRVHLHLSPHLLNPHLLLSLHILLSPHLLLSQQHYVSSHLHCNPHHHLSPHLLLIPHLYLSQQHHLSSDLLLKVMSL